MWFSFSTQQSVTKKPAWLGFFLYIYINFLLLNLFWTLNRVARIFLGFGTLVSHGTSKWPRLFQLISLAVVWEVSVFHGLLTVQCGYPASRCCCCCSGSPVCCWWRGLTRASPSTWTSRSPGASRRSAAKSSASCASAARRTRTRTRRLARCPRRSCCFTTARGSCWRSARVWLSLRASARAARKTIMPRRCRGLTCCHPALTQVSFQSVV